MHLFLHFFRILFINTRVIVSVLHTEAPRAVEAPLWLCGTLCTVYMRDSRGLHVPDISAPVKRTGRGVTWQRRPATRAGPWSGRSGSESPRCSPTCTSSPWPTRTGGPVATRSPPSSSSSSGTTRSAAASRCSPVCTTVSCSCAAFASQTKVRTSEHLHEHSTRSHSLHSCFIAFFPDCPPNSTTFYAYRCGCATRST